MDKEDYGLLFAVLVPAGLSVAAAVAMRVLRSEGKLRAARTDRMAQAARSLGLRFYGADERLLAALPECSLLEQGDSRRVDNLMADAQRPPGRLVFDFEYSRARQTHDHYATGALYLVAMVGVGQGAELPRASVYRTDWFGGPVGARDVYAFDGLEDPDFSTGYLLSGRPARSVRAMLTGPVRDAIKTWEQGGPRPVVETMPGWLAVYVESEPDDRRVDARCADVVRYAERIAGALGGPRQAMTR